MDPEKSYNLNDNLFPWYFGNHLVDIVMIQSRPPLIAVLASGQYGLVSLPTRAKKYRCIWPHKNSRVCGHVQMYENHEGCSQESREEVMLSQNKVSAYDFLKDIPDFDINGEIKKLPSEGYESKHRKLNWPLTSDSIEKFRKLAVSGYSYEYLLDLIPQHTDQPCIHGYSFESG